MRETHEVLEQLVFKRLEVDRLACAGDAMRHEVHLQVVHLEDGRLLRAARAPQQRLHARHELGHGEGFGQIVVAARLKAADLRVDATSSPSSFGSMMSTTAASYGPCMAATRPDSPSETCSVV